MCLVDIVFLKLISINVREGEGERVGGYHLSIPQEMAFIFCSDTCIVEIYNFINDVDIRHRPRN